MDFGIARSTGRPVAGPVPGNNDRQRSAAAQHRVRDATVLGAVIGTVEYMAPEQAKGQHVDQRADIYALGLIVYDMLVGQAPRASAPRSALAELKARMEKPPPPINPSSRRSRRP